MSSIFLNTSSSSSSTTSSSSTLRVPGLASGLDTDSIVKSMVSNYQTKIDKVNQAKQTLQWQQEAYRDIIKDIKGLQDYFDPLSSKYILSSNSLNINTAASDNSAIVSATAGATAKAGTYSMKVTQMAEQAKISGDPSSINVNADKLDDWKGKTIEFSVGDDTYKINISNDISNRSVDLVSEINKQIQNSGKENLDGKISASYVNDGKNSYIKFTNTSSDTIKILKNDNTTLQTITKEVLINNGISENTKLSDLYGSEKGNVTFSINGNKVTIDTTSSTLKDLMDKVKSATGGTVTMSVDDATGSISFQSKDYGSSANVTLEDSNDFLKSLGFNNITNSIGKDAIVETKEPGQSTSTTTTQSSNQFSINGISYNVVNTGTANITITSDSDKVVDNMKKFIDDYNSVISKINTKLTEKKDSDYPPLTDSQREAMSDDQIKNWEAKAKVGILRNDDYLSSLMTQLRGAFSTPVYNNYDSSNTGKISLSFGSYGTGAVGIDTSTDTTDGGKLILKDETKLKSAIENNFEDFKKLFSGRSDSTLSTNQSYIGSKKYKEDGLFTRIDSILRDYVAAPGLGKDGTYSLAGTMNIFVNKQYDYTSTGSGSQNTLPDQVYAKTSQISKLNTQMSDAETRYYAKFTALETALNTLNSQQSALTYMLGTS